jgi:flagellar biosynthesis protein FlhB
MSEKAEQATPKREQRARDDGDSGLSTNLAQAVAFALAVAVLPLWLGAFIEFAAHAMREAMAHPHETSPSAQQVATTVLVLTCPPLLLVAAASGLVQLLQTRGVFSAKRLAPNFAKLNPIDGLKQLVSATRLFSIARALLFCGVVIFWAFQGLRDNARNFAAAAGSAMAATSVAAPLLKTLLFKVAVLGLSLGALDFLISRASWQKRIKMTKDEVRREHKENDGDPELKSARERAHREALEFLFLQHAQQLGLQLHRNLADFIQKHAAFVRQFKAPDALRDGHLAGAYLDTFGSEPYCGVLCKFDQALLTPHVGSYTVECRRQMEMEAVENLLSGLNRR